MSALPGGIERIRVRGYYWGDDGDGSDKIVHAKPSLTALTNIHEHGWLRAEQAIALPDEDGYFAFDLIPTNHPDLTPFLWTIYSNYAPELTIELPYDTPLVDIDGELVRAVWLLDAATEGPPPDPIDAYYTAEQTREAIAEAVQDIVAGTATELVRATGTADIALSGHRVVTRLPNGNLGYASNDDELFIDAPLWLTTGAVSSGALVAAVAFGKAEEPSWNWTLGSVYLGTDGQLTQTPPTAPDAVFLVEVASADSATSLFVNRQPSIKLI